MKVYLAARFSDRAYMELVADRLKSLGVEITSTWNYGGEEGLDREGIAMLDLKDVDRCDTLVSYTQPLGTMTKGGGRHVEFGYGLAKGKRLILIGEQENVFHHHPDVLVFPTLNAWLVSDGLIAPEPFIPMLLGDDEIPF
jgi:nucleoside 2-deoxyribosyltransferase